MPNEWDRTPWMMGGGARHSVNVGRLLAYAAFGGGEGVIGGADLQVKAANVPDGTVRVMPGACAILNRGLNITYEAYAARLPITDTVAISPTGSGSGRSDLVVAVVMNPYQDGEPWPDPDEADVLTGTAEFVKTMVIPNVAANTKTVTSLGLGYSAIPLARIDIPANTGTITQPMIVDLRKMSQRRSSRILLSAPSTDANLIVDGIVREMPSYKPTIEVPSWATTMIVTAEMTGAGHINPDVSGHLMVSLGAPFAQQGPWSTYEFPTSGNPDGWEAVTLKASGTFNVSGVAGQSFVVSMAARRAGGTGYVRAMGAGRGTMMSYDVQFFEDVR